MYEVKEKVFDIKKRTFNFGVNVIKLVQDLPKNTVGFAIGSQLIRSGTSVGANIEESQNAESRKEFIYGLTVSLKEARETEYWLKIIKEVKLVKDLDIDVLLNEITELIKILITIIKKSKSSS